MVSKIFQSVSNMAENLNIDTDRRSLRLVKSLDERRQKGKYDFTIIIGTQTIRAERNVLAAGSDYFDRMFSHETNESKMRELTLKNVDFESVRSCIDFIYGRKVSVSPEKYEDLMFSANKLMLEDLSEAIEEKMTEKLSVHNFFAMRRAAIRLVRTNLAKKCQTFAEENIDSISKEEMFNKVEISFIESLLKSSTVRVSEQRKLEILLEFVRFEEDRTKDLPKLLRCIDVSQIDPDVGQSFIRNEPLIKENCKCLCYFSLALYEAMKPKENILLFCNSPNLRLLFPKRKQINDLAFVKPNVRKYSVVNLQDHVYVLGEDQSVQRLKYLEQGASWEHMEDMIEKHGSRPPAVILSGCIYVVGGHATKAVERFLAAENKWARLPNRPYEIHLAEVLTSGGYIYSFGGSINNQCVNYVSRLNMKTSQWETLSPMLETKGSVSAAQWQGIVYVAGGFHKAFRNTFESYDPSADHWTILPYLKVARCWLKLIPINGILYAVGGSRGSSNSTAIETNDLEDNKWTTMELDESEDFEIVNSVAVTVKCV